MWALRKSGVRLREIVRADAIDGCAGGSPSSRRGKCRAVILLSDGHRIPR
jgi:hypothetical protein